MTKKERELEKKVAKRFVAIRKRRDQEKRDDPTCDFDSVIELMERAAKELSEMPDDHEWSTAALEQLEDARDAATKLKMGVEAIFEVINGTEGAS